MENDRETEDGWRTNQEVHVTTVEVVLGVPLDLLYGRLGSKVGTVGHDGGRSSSCKKGPRQRFIRARLRWLVPLGYSTRVGRMSPGQIFVVRNIQHVVDALSCTPYFVLLDFGHVHDAVDGGD